MIAGGTLPPDGLIGASSKSTLGLYPGRPLPRWFAGRAFGPFNAPRVAISTAQLTWLLVGP